VHNVSQWPNLKHLAEPLGGAVGLLEAAAYLGGHGAMPPLWPDHENFLQATLYEKVRFCHFQARIAKFNNV